MILMMDIVFIDNSLQYLINAVYLHYLPLLLKLTFMYKEVLENTLILDFVIGKRLLK
jgi:hypothetical protein